jgi:hypothetical protein
MLKKYLKYKNKYLELKNNLHGGINEENKNKPLLIYLIGQEDKNIQRKYICTFLFQLELFTKYCGINNDRVNVIYGDNKSNEHTCYNTNAGDKNNKPLPYGIDVNYTNNYDLNDFIKLIKTILINKANENTPIIFIYDGHGYKKTGIMVINTNISVTSETFIDLFSNNEINKKLFILTQCGSYSFYQSLILNPLVLPNSIYICSTNNPDMCGYGAQVLLKFTRLIENKIYNTFNNMKSDLEKLENDDIFYLNDSNNIKIKDILLLYNPINRLKIKNEIYLVTDNNKFIGYDINKVREPNSIIEKQSIWIIDNIINLQDNIYLSLTTKETYKYENNDLQGYLNNFDHYSNEIRLWNKTILTSPLKLIEKDFYKLNNDLSLQSLGDNWFLLYDIQKNIFISGETPSENLHLVKIKLL